MSVFDILSLLGGLAMFLYGMRLMGDSLKENSSGALKVAMEHVTNNPVKAFVLGLLVTAIIQSSKATIVITSGLVGAGVLTLHQSLGIIVGANVGTTITGQIIRLLDLEAAGGVVWLRLLQPAALSSMALIAGMAIIMSGRVKNARSIGGIAIGFGILFAGLLNMTGTVDTLTQSGMVEQMFVHLGDSPLLGYVTGAAIAFVLQSSSATVGILQAFSASGLLTFKAIYAVIVGIYLGDCLTTAIVCSIGAESDQKRVGVINVLYNLSKTAVVLAGVLIAHKTGLLDGLWDSTVNSGVIANTNSVFNLVCAVLLMPMVGVYEAQSRRIVKDSPAPETPKSPYQEKMDALNPVFFHTPALALNACYELLLTIFAASRANVEKSFRLLDRFDSAVYQEVLAEEVEIDRMTDRVSRYAMELLPHLQLEYHVSILDQYYKVITEFERLGDHGVNIAKNAEGLSRHKTAYASAARREISVLEQALDGILDLTETAFRRRSLDAAREIEPRVRAAGEVITVLRRRRRERIQDGQPDTYAEASFTSLLIEVKRITAVCSNVGVATVVRVNPELADHEHRYYERLRSGEDEAYNAAFKAAHEEYFAALERIETE